MVKGSCLCGAIQYQVELLPGKIFTCHCQFCRKAHGADSVTMALGDGRTLTVLDENGYLVEHLNDIGGYRAFCRHCGTRLMNYAPDKALYFSVTLSTVDAPVDMQPVAHLNVESKAPWCSPCDGIPQYPGMPEELLN